MGDHDGVRHAGQSGGVTAPISCRRSHCRKRLTYSLLSPPKRRGRVRGRSVCRPRTLLAKVSTYVASCAWPARSKAASGRLLPSTGGGSWCQSRRVSVPTR